MQTSSTSPRPLAPWQNPYSMTLGQGNAIDWSRVSAYFFNVGKFTVKLSAGAAVGAETLAVDALSYGIKKGTVLDFGNYEPVTVTTSAQATAGATSISVNALSGPLPNGTILNFTGAGEFAMLTAAAAAGATSLTVEALDATIESADTATFDGGAINAEVVADADAGDTSLSVEPLQFAIANDAEALADGTGTNDGRMIPAGTVMARTSAGLLIPRRDAVAEQAIGFLVSDAEEGAAQDAKTGYGIVIGNTTIYENLCPDADGAGDLPSAYKTELGTNTLGFVFVDWADDRVV